MACRLCLDYWGTTTCVVSSRPACTESAEEPISVQRDINAVVATQAPSVPGSPRQFNWADSIYLGSLRMPQPTQYLQFNGDEITIVTPQDLDATASSDANITASNTLKLSGNSIQAGASAVPVCSQPLVTWINSTLLPALLAHGITVSAPPSNALTSTFGAS
jgi:hypothetical protein